jgi:hypothetical protein
MKQIATLIVAVAVLAVPQAAAKPGAPRLLLGIVEGPGLSGVSVVQLDPLTLKPLSRAAPTGAPNVGLVGRFGVRAAFTTGSAAIRFLNHMTMRWEFRVAYPGAPAETVWNFADRMVTVTQSSTAEMIIVDPTKRRLAAFRSLGGSLSATATTRDQIVAVVAPLEGIGAAKLVVIDDRGHIQTARLPGIQAGTETVSTDPYTLRYARPALAIDSTGKRAVVIAADGNIADVRLDTLATASHSVSSRSLTAVRKMASGTSRTALWINSTTLALTGTDVSFNADGQHSTPAGLTLIDTRDWSARSVDTTTSGIAFSGVALLAFGGTSVAGYSIDGDLRYRLFGDRPVWGVDCIAGSFAYFADPTGKRFTIVDTLTGAIVGTVETKAPTQLTSFYGY